MAKVKTALQKASELLELIEKSGVLEGPALRTAKKFAEEESDAPALADRLVEYELLTRWQADQLLAGQFVLKLGDSKFILVDESGPWEFGRSLIAEVSGAEERVSLKLISSRLLKGKAEEKSLLSDLTKLAKLKGQGFEAFREVGRAGPRMFLVSELPSAGRVDTLAEKWGPMGNLGVVRLLEQLAKRLHLMHNQGIAHSLLLPRKILLSEDGTPTITDCGLATLVPALLADANVRRQIQAYRPPDDGNGHASGPQSDLYALARIARYLRDSSATSSEDVPPWWCEASSLDAADQSLEQLLQKLEASNEDGGFATARDLQAACAAWLAEFAQDASLSSESDSDEEEPSHEVLDVAEEGEASAEEVVGLNADEEDEPSDESALDDELRLEDEDEKVDDATPKIVIDTGKDTTRKPIAAGAVKIEPNKRRKKSKAKAAATEDANAVAVASRKPSGMRMLVVCAVLLLLVGTGVTLGFVYRDRLRTAKKPNAEVARTNVQPTSTAAPKKTAQSVVEAPLPDTSDGLPPPPPDPGVAAVGSAPADSPPAVAVADANQTKPSPPGTTPAKSGTDADGPSSPSPDTVASAAPTAAPAVTANEPKDNARPVPNSSPSPNPEPPASNPPSSTPPATERPGDQPSEPAPAKPAPATPAPKYLAQLPAAVSMPPLEPPATEPVELAPIPVDDQVACYLDLLGGDRVVKGSESLKMENAAGGTDPRRWDVFVVSGPGQRTAVGQFSLLGGKLAYRWLDDVDKNSIAGQVENCFLQIRIGKESKVLGLRKTISAPPIVMELERGASIAKVDLPNGPDPASCRFEILGFEGPFPKHELNPKGSISAENGHQWILLGDNPNERVMVLYLDTTLRRQFVVNVTALLPAEGDPDESWLRDRERKISKSMRTKLGKAIQAQLVAAQTNVARLSGQDESRIQDRKLKEQVTNAKNLAKVDLERAERDAKIMQQIEQLCQTLHGTGKIHYRVVFEADGRSIELIRSEGAPASK